MTTKNQLTDILNGYDTSLMTFSKPQPHTIPETSFQYDTIDIGTKYPDGTFGDLLVSTLPDLFSFGLSPNVDKSTQKLKGYSFPISFYDKDSQKMAAPTPDQKQWMDNFNNIMKNCVKHIMANLAEVGLDEEFPESQLRNFNPMFYTKVKDPVTGKPTKKIQEGAGPVLYTKVMYSLEKQSFTTMFFDADHNEVNPLDLIGKYYKSTSIIKIESIFINGDRITPQIKLYETIVVEQKNERISYLGPSGPQVFRPKAITKVSVDDSDGPPMIADKEFKDDADDSDDDPNGSPIGAKDPDPIEEEPAPAPAPVKKVTVKRNIRKAAPAEK